MNFSKKIKNFLSDTGKLDKFYISEVPKSSSCGQPGDFMIFRYRPAYNSKLVQDRVLLLVEPIVKDAKTGNILMTGFDVPVPGNYGPIDLITLYTEKRLPKNNYRTFILNRIIGPLYRVRP